MKKYLIIEGDALDLMRIHRKGAMARDAAADEPLDNGGAHAEKDFFSRGEDMGATHIADEDEPLDGDPFLDDVDGRGEGPDMGDMGEDIDSLPNQVKQLDVPEPDAGGGYAEEPVEMPWSGHSVNGNADFGPDHDTEESTIIDPDEGEEFAGGHAEEYGASEEEEGFGKTPGD